MPFMVIYRTSDGAERHEEAEAIDEAALFVERLRNTEGIDQVRIFRVEEIHFAFRPYYKVELGPAPHQGDTAVSSDPIQVVTDIEAPVDRTDGAVAEATLPPPPGATSEANGERRGLFGR